MNETIVDRIKLAREGARVQRTHASPGLLDHSVGIHSFNMLSVLFILHPNPSVMLIRAVHQHDLPERRTGDMPHPAKKAGIQNNEAQEQFERLFNKEVFGQHCYDHLTDEEKRWQHGLDMLDFYCHVKDEIMAGNHSIRTKRLAVEDYMKKYRHLYPEEVLEAYEWIRRSEWYQMPDIGGE